MKHLLFISLILAAMAAHAAEPQDNYYTGVSTEIVTPHFTWAKPYAGGATKVLVIAPAWGQRETVELQQRFDFDCRAVMTETYNNLAQQAGFLAPDKVALRFDEGLAWQPDVIIIGGINWGMLLLEHRAEILKQVFAGAGLVYVGPPESEELAQLFSRGVEDRSAVIAAGVPWAMLTALKDRQPADVIKSGQFGQGRWVSFNYPTNSTNQSLTPSLWPWPAAWEYEPCLSLVGRAVLCAGKREPHATLDPPAQDAFLRSALPATVTLATNATDSKSTLRCSFMRLPDGRAIAAAPAALAGGQLRVTVPVLPAGRYLANCVLSEGQGRALNWGSFPLTVSAPVQVALTLSKPGYDAGEAVAGQAKLSAALAPGQSLRVSLRDNHDRLLAIKARAEGQQLDFSFPAVQPLGTAIHRVEAAVVDAQGEMASAQVQFSIRYRTRPAFHLACWEESEVDYISGLWYKRFRELGMDAIFYRSDRGTRDAAARLIAEADMFGASAFAGYYPKSEQSDLGPVHNPCLHDPAYQEASREAAHKSEPFALHDNLFYPSGSDAGMRGNCFSPQTLAAFRQWLQERYKSLAELNATWGTQFAGWEAVVPVAAPGASRSDAGTRQDGTRFTSWLEHTRFIEQSYREHLQDISGTIQGFDPQALVGEDGYGWLNSTDGADWWNLLQNWGFVNLYTYQDPPQMEIVRSLCQSMPNVKLRSLYWGSYDGQFGNLAFMRRLPWYALLHDYNGLFWWVANGKTTWGCAPGVVAGPDFRATRTYLTSLREIEDIRRGIAELIQPARRRHDGVAIFYDQTNVHAVTAYKHPSALVGAYTVFQDLCEDLGLQYDYVAGAQVEQGMLPERGYRVLVMAQALALSDEAAKQVREFVSEGGMIVADVLPGQYDALLRPAPNGSLLADLFGQPGETRTVGKGWTHLLADWPARYHYQRTDEAAQEAREKLQGLLQPLQLAPPVTFAGADGAGVPGVEKIVYDRAGTSFVALTNGADGPVSGLVKAPRQPRVYDVRRHEYLGELRDWPVELQPGETKLFALCPYQVTGLEIKAAQNPIVAGQPWQAQVQVKAQPGPPNAAHSFVLEVADPSGKPQPLYGQALPAGEGGGATVAIPFALDDAPGQWKVRVTETISGTTAECSVKVAAAGR